MPVLRTFTSRRKFFLKGTVTLSLSSRLNASAGHRFWSRSKRGLLCSHAPTAFPGFLERSEGQQRWLAIVASTGIVITIPSIRFLSPYSTSIRSQTLIMHLPAGTKAHSTFSGSGAQKETLTPRLRLDIKLCHGLAGCGIQYDFLIYGLILGLSHQPLDYPHLGTSALEKPSPHSVRVKVHFK